MRGTIHKPVKKNSAQQLLTYGRNLIPNMTLHLLHCVWAIHVYAFFRVSRHPELSGPATLQVMGYPLHENALRPSLTRYILHRSIFTEHGLKWHGIISAPYLPHRVEVRSEMCQPALRHSVWYMCWHCVAGTVTGLHEDVDEWFKITLNKLRCYFTDSCNL
jgi:hypothetical protein